MSIVIAFDRSKAMIIFVVVLADYCHKPKPRHQRRVTGKVEGHSTQPKPENKTCIARLIDKFGALHLISLSTCRVPTYLIFVDDYFAFVKASKLEHNS